MDARRELDQVEYHVQTKIEADARDALWRINEPTLTELALGITRANIMLNRDSRLIGQFATAVRGVGAAAEQASAGMRGLATTWMEMKR